MWKEERLFVQKTSLNPRKKVWTHWNRKDKGVCEELQNFKRAEFNELLFVMEEVGNWKKEMKKDGESVFLLED